MRPVPRVFFAALALALGALLAHAAVAIDWWTVDGGGGTSTGGSYEVTGTVGQPDASTADAMAGAGVMLTGGFWGVTLPACTTFVEPDFDQDCDVDADDFDKFKACATGDQVLYNPNSPALGCTFIPSSGHITPDFDQDGDVDIHDFAKFQRCISGSNVAVQPGCDL